MRYLVQFAIPALIVLLTFVVLSRRRGVTKKNPSDENTAGSDTGIFILILLIGATVATAAFIVIGGFWT